MFTAVLKRACSVVIVLLLFMCSGCYTTDQEIFSASEAVAIPGLPGDYSTDNRTCIIYATSDSIPGLPGDYSTDNRTCIIYATSDSKAYRFRDGNGEGFFRCIPFYNDIYIVQAKYDDESSYRLLFERITKDGSGYHLEELPCYPSESGSLAEKHHVSIVDVVNGTLSGPRANIRNFLYAHKNLGWE